MRIKDLATRATKLLTGNAYMVFDNGTKVEKVDYAELAKQIITEYNTQTLAGSAQSVKSALDALNSNKYDITVPKSTNAIPANADFNDYTTPGKYAVTATSTMTTLANRPSGSRVGVLHVEKLHNTTYILQTYINGIDDSGTAFMYKRLYNNSSWTDWEKIPTRAEVDALNSKFSDYKDITATTSNSGSISLAPLGVGAGSSLTSAYIRAEGATMDYTVLLLRTYSGNWYAKVINWDLTPVVNTQVTVRLIGTVTS